jgi:hypothetical protein
MRIFTLTLITLGCLTLVSHAHAQSSPPASASVTINGSTLTVQYSSPSVRGRQIFGAGGLLSRDPNYPVWRAGANDATTFTTTADLDLAGLRVPRGRYSLFVDVRNPEAWELIVNRQTGQSGLEYDAKQDLGRVKMMMSRPTAVVERLKYTLSDKGNRTGELRLEWERHVGAVAITVR